MTFSISSSLLLKQASAISGIIILNPLMPILENFLFEIEPGKLTITSSDARTFMTTHLPIDTQEAVQVAVPARILLDTLKNLPEQPIQFHIDEKSYTISIHSKNGSYKLAGENATDFPVVENCPKKNIIHIPAKFLKKAIVQTNIAISNNELKPALSGVYVKVNEQAITFVAIDGHRLVRYIKKDSGVVADIPSIIIPGKTLLLLSTLLAYNEMNIKILFDEKKIYFEIGHIHIITSLLYEKYPDYENVIPVNNPYQLTITRLDLISSLKRIAIYANKTTHQIKLAITQNELTISAEDFDFSNEAIEKLNCEYTGDTIEIGFNVKFLIEMLQIIDTEEVQMFFSEPSKASLIFPKEQKEKEDVLLLIMPIILKK